jgi:hypothetical protein
MRENRTGVRTRLLAIFPAQKMGLKLRIGVEFLRCNPNTLFGSRCTPPRGFYRAIIFETIPLLLTPSIRKSLWSMNDGKWSSGSASS